MQRMACTVVVVDDNPVFRAAARRLLELEGYEVIGEAANAASALAAVDQLQPEVLLLDVVLPDGSGLDVAEQLACGNTRVVLVSSRDPEDFGARLRRCGALGLIPKNELSGERLAAVLERKR
jgi:DNA-binding NarL/FixJ family response regulator